MRIEILALIPLLSSCDSECGSGVWQLVASGPDGYCIGSGVETALYWPTYSVARTDRETRIENLETPGTEITGSLWRDGTDCRLALQEEWVTADGTEMMFSLVAREVDGEITGTGVLTWMFSTACEVAVTVEGTLE